MRYSFYKSEQDGIICYKLYFKDQIGVIRYFKFVTDIEGISNVPTITRLFGEEIDDKIGDYFLYPLDYKLAEAGEFMLLEENNKYFRFEFLNEEEDKLQGMWILRKLSNGSYLFWKPSPIAFVPPTKNVVVTENAKGKVVEQEFGMFDLVVDKNTFHGIAAAEGIWTGRDWHTTLFSDKNIEDIANQLKKNRSSLLVDYNHDKINDGIVDSVELKTRRGLKYIEVSGSGGKPIPLGSGLSVSLKSNIKWDENIGVWALDNVEVIGLSIMQGETPGCTICMIQ